MQGPPQKFLISPVLQNKSCNINDSKISSDQWLIATLSLLCCNHIANVSHFLKWIESSQINNNSCASLPLHTKK